MLVKRVVAASTKRSLQQGVAFHPPNPGVSFANVVLADLEGETRYHSCADDQSIPAVDDSLQSFEVENPTSRLLISACGFSTSNCSDFVANSVKEDCFALLVNNTLT
jgi:hypothetical protein